jgi:cation/acetate symporter
MIVGTLSALVLIFLSPTIWVQLLGNPKPIFPLSNPGLVTIPLAFAVGIVVSKLFPDAAADAAFPAMQRRLHLGGE